MVSFVFPGQGSQYGGMGGTLFDEFGDLTAVADRILNYSIKELCLENNQGALTKTQFTQPALFVVNALTYLKTVRETGRAPHFVAGHSLGEYNALFAADVFDFETGLRLVKRRGELMSKATSGSMAAVRYDGDTVRRVLKENDLGALDVANYNSPMQTIVSGPLDELNKAKPFFEVVEKRYKLLNVSGAFHSRYMADAAREFAAYLNSFTFRSPKLPVISNVHARPYRANEIKDNLVKQLTSPVRWVESIQYLLSQGEMEIEEVGPGEVLQGLVRAIRRDYASANAVAEARVAQTGL